MADLLRRIKEGWRALTMQLEPLRARIQKALDAMSPRDRMLLYGMGAFLAVMLLGIGTAVTKSRLSRVEGDLELRTGQLMLVKGMKSTYEDGSQRLEELQARIRSHEGTTLSSFLEKSADGIQIRDSLKQVRERSVTTLDNLEDRLYSVQLSRISLEQLAGFLYEIETSGYPLMVRSMKVKTLVVGGEKVLDVTMDISSFRLLQEDESE